MPSRYAIGDTMDIIDAKPDAQTCGCMSAYHCHANEACCLPAGHDGSHRGPGGGAWIDSMAVWPDRLAIGQPEPTTSIHPPVLDLLIETLRARSAAGTLKYGTRLKPFNGRDALIDLLHELADGCMYVMQAIAERDAVAQQCHNCNSTMVQCAGCEFSGTWDRALSPRPEREDHTAQVETLTKERDLARSELDLCVGRLQTAVEEVVVLRGKFEQARANPPPLASPLPCPHSKAKQVGSSSYVIRRCKLADGHDGMCEPA